MLLKCDYMTMQADARLGKIRRALGRRQSCANRQRLVHRLRKAERFDDKAFAVLDRHCQRSPFNAILSMLSDEEFELIASLPLPELPT